MVRAISALLGNAAWLAAAIGPSPPFGSPLGRLLATGLDQLQRGKLVRHQGVEVPAEEAAADGLALLHAPSHGNGVPLLFQLGEFDANGPAVQLPVTDLAPAVVVAADDVPDRAPQLELLELVELEVAALDQDRLDPDDPHAEQGDGRVPGQVQHRLGGRIALQLPA